MAKILEATATPETQKYWDALKEVNDPEFPISVVDMGLIYNIEKEGSKINVNMTFTSTGCGCMVWMQDDVEERLLQEDGIDEVEINVVWEPAWTVEMLTEAGREQLRKWGVRA